MHNCPEALFCLAVDVSTVVVCGASGYSLSTIVHICSRWAQGVREFSLHFKIWP